MPNGERYITQELKELEEKILTAGERITYLEAKLFDEVREAVSAELHRVQATASAVARLGRLLRAGRGRAGERLLPPRCELLR